MSSWKTTFSSSLNPLALVHSTFSLNVGWKKNLNKLISRLFPGGRNGVSKGSWEAWCQQTRSVFASCYKKDLWTIQGHNDRYTLNQWSKQRATLRNHAAQPEGNFVTTLWALSQKGSALSFVENGFSFLHFTSWGLSYRLKNQRVLATKGKMDPASDEILGHIKNLG